MKSLSAIPKKLTDAKATQPTYKNSATYPELAALCMQYKIAEDTFEACLKLDKQKKTSDNLPNVVVDGASIRYPQYCIVKLPIQDPRAYLLGKIANGDLSMGDYDEELVVNGLTQKDDGFYVLLQSKAANIDSKAAHPKPIINGKIDYANFDIVGQSYAWLNSEGNFVFECWSYVHSHAAKVNESLLEKFSKEVANGKTRITVVITSTKADRRAPYDNFHNEFQIFYNFAGKRSNPNIAGGDSTSNGKHYINYDLVSALNIRLALAVRTLVKDEKIAKRIKFNFNYVRSVQQVESLENSIKKLSENKVFQQFIQKPENLKLFAPFSDTSTDDESFAINQKIFKHIDALSILLAEGLLTANIIHLIFNAEHSYSTSNIIASKLAKLNRHGVLTEEVVNKIKIDKNPYEYIKALEAKIDEKEMEASSKKHALVTFKRKLAEGVCVSIADKLRVWGVYNEAYEKQIAALNYGQVSSLSHLLKAYAHVYDGIERSEQQYFEAVLKDDRCLAVLLSLEKNKLDEVIELIVGRLPGSSTLDRVPKKMDYKSFCFMLEGNIAQKIKSIVFWLGEKENTSIFSIIERMKKGESFASIVPFVPSKPPPCSCTSTSSN